MKSYKDITNKYLKHNKGRTILTIFGVILSVALITSVGLFIKSLQSSYIQRVTQDVGSFHGTISENNDKIYSQISNNPKIDKVGLKEYCGQWNLKSSKVLNVHKLNKNAFNLLSYKVLQGRLPKNKDEIAIESWILRYIHKDLKVGSEINIKYTDGKSHKFKIVGIMPNKFGSQFENKGVGITFSNEFNKAKSKMYFTISKKADISDTMEELKGSFKNVKTNEQLLRYLGEASNGNINKSLYSMAGIIIAVIVVITIAVIYNSFQISVVERIKQFGLLRAVGATPKQIRKIVLREASIISIIAIPLGILCGMFAIYVVTLIFKIIDNSSSVVQGMHLVVSFPILGISVLIALFAIYISAIIPSKFAGRVSPIVAITSRNSITKEKIKKRRGKIAKHILNINGLMAFRNIKRNRKRFNVTVFSIAISVILIIFFGYYLEMIVRFNSDETEQTKFQFGVQGSLLKNGKSSLSSEIMNKIKNNNNVKNIYVSYPKYQTISLINKEDRNSKILNAKSDIYKNKKLNNKEYDSLNVLLNVYDSNKLNDSKKYLTEGKIDENEMVKENGIILVKDELFRNKDKIYRMPLTNLKVGDSLYIDKNFEIQDFTKKPVQNTKISKDIAKVKIAGIVDKAPYYFSSNGESLRVIVPKKVLANISKVNTKLMPYTYTGIVIKDKSKQENFSNWLRDLGDRNRLGVIDIIKQMEQQKTSTLQMKILIYGFIIVICLISAVNIVNTITTNLILRRKEIASLNAIGMTYKNIRSMILTEGVLYGIYGVIIGSFIGTLLSKSITSSISYAMELDWTIPWKYIFISSAGAILIGILSVIKPLNKIKKNNLIDVIREE